MNKVELKTSLLRILLTVFFFLLSLGQLQRFQLTQQIAVYLHEVLLVAMVVLFSKDLVLLYQKVISYASSRKSFLLFVGFFVIQTAIYQVFKLDLLSLSYLARILLYSQIFFLVKIAIDLKAFSKQQFYLLLIGLSALIAMFGFIQYFIWPDTRWLVLMGWDDHFYRFISTLFDPGFTGLIIAFGLGIYLQIFSKQSPFWKNLLISFFFMVAVLLTYSRATYLSIFIMLLFNLIISKQKKLYFIILLFFALIPFLPRPTGEGVRLERTASISSRITSNQTALEGLSFTEVIWGRGLYRNIKASGSDLPSHAIAPDNSFVFLFVSFGILGAGTLLWVILQFRELLWSEPFRSALILLSVHSLFNNSLFYIWSLVFVFTLFSIQRVIPAKAGIKA